MSIKSGSPTIWDKLKSSTTNLHSSHQEKAPKYKPSKDPNVDPKKGLKSKLVPNSLESNNKKKDAYYVEKDGDDETSTVVHKAMVKYYRTLRKNTPELYHGYPDWLGHKETEEDILYQQQLDYQREQLGDDGESSEPAEEQRREVKREEPVVNKPTMLQSGYKPLSARPLYKTTHTSMRNLNLNDNQNDFVGERLQAEKEGSSANMPKKSYSMRDRMKRR